MNYDFFHVMIGNPGGNLRNFGLGTNRDTTVGPIQHCIEPSHPRKIFEWAMNSNIASSQSLLALLLRRISNWNKGDEPIRLPWFAKVILANRCAAIASDLFVDSTAAQGDPEIPCRFTLVTKKQLRPSYTHFQKSLAVATVIREDVRRNSYEDC